MDPKTKGLKYSNYGQRGATLLEVVIATSLMAVFVLTMALTMEPWLDFQRKVSTENKLARLQTILSNVYRTNAGFAEIYADERIALRSEPGVGGAYTAIENIGCSDEDNNPTLLSLVDALADYNITRDMLIDGYQRPLCIAITARQRKLVSSSGVAFGSGNEFEDVGETWIYYHTLYLVSRGKNGILESVSALNSDPMIEGEGDDLAMIVDGWEIQKGIYEETLRKVLHVKKAYERYVHTRFRLSGSQDPTQTPFHNGTAIDPVTGVVAAIDPGVPALDREYIQADTTGGAVASRAMMVPVSSEEVAKWYVPLRTWREGSADAPVRQDSLALMTTLGLTEDETRLPVSAFPKSGLTHVAINNSQGNRIKRPGRTPGQGSQGVNLPPYSAEIVAQLPGPLTMRVSGQSTQYGNFISVFASGSPP